MKRIFTILLFSCFLNSFSQTAVPAGNVSGTWSLAGSPYQVMGHIQIPDGQTLTIDPGVVVEFQGHYKLNVQGRLLAIGTAADTIAFTAADTTTGWWGIRFDNTPATNDTSRIKYCKLRYGKAVFAPDESGGGGYFNNFSKVTICNSRISNCSANASGGGIYCLNSSPTIINNIISNNLAVSSGGAIWCNNSNPIITGNTISGNFGTYAGGGISLFNVSNPNISNNIISNNTGGNGGGGGIYCWVNTKPTIANNIISHNLTNSNGGGIYCNNSESHIINNSISNNSSMYGGVYCNNGTPTIINNTISSNETGIYLENSNPNIVSNIISNNSGGYGGVYCNNSNPVISNNTISNNETSAVAAGGISCNGSSPIIMNNTISNNIAYIVGGIFCTYNSNPTIFNCILWNNISISSGIQVPLQVFLNDNGSDPNFYYCDVQGSLAAFSLSGNSYTGIYQNNIDADPKFIAPSAGVGTGFDGVTADWSLQATSPCIDMGDPIGTYPTTDKAGNPRVNVCRIDMGAYEYQSGNPLSVSITQTQQILCHGAADAALTANPVGGAPSDTYSYAWSNGSTSSSIIGLPAGVHSVTVSTTVSQCHIVASYTVSEPAQMIISAVHKDDNACNAINDGIASVNVSGGVFPYTYLWVNNGTTNSISGLTVGNYSVTVSDNNGCITTNTITIGSLSTTITPNFITVPDTCIGGVGKITTSPSGGMGAYTFVWSTGSSAQNISGLSSGNYTTTISDSLGCAITSTTTIGIYTSTITTIFTSTPADCHEANGSITALPGGGTNPYSYNWSSGNTLQTASNLLAGNYTVNITDKNGCIGNGNFSVGTSSGIATPAICMVTVDSLSQNNVIMWDKTGYSHIDSFIVYREISTNIYKRIGAVQYSNLSLFTDTIRAKYFPNTGNPNSGTYRYKLQMRDSCGNYSQLSPFHNTIYIINNNGTFSWPQLYTIDGGLNPVNNYVLMRDNMSNGSWTVVGSVSGTQQTITDPQYSAYTSASWRVETQWGINCIPTRISSSIQTFNVSRSNIFSLLVTEADKYYGESVINIYPNPFSETATLQIINPLNNYGYEIKIFNSIGKLVKVIAIEKGMDNVKIDREDLGNGFYVYKLENNSKLVGFGKFVIQ